MGSIPSLVGYLSHLRGMGRVASYARKHVAAIAFFVKAAGGRDNTGCFLVRQALKGWQRLEGARPDARRPIDSNRLAAIWEALGAICASPAEVLLFRAAFSLAFYGAFRVGELVARSKTDDGGGLQWTDLELQEGMLAIRLARSKTDQLGRGSRITLHRCPGEKVCPVANLEAYMAIRPVGAGSALLLHSDATPLSRYQFTRVLAKAVAAAGLPPGGLTPHSFRIGAATTAAAMGLGGRTVQRIGRWRSDCYKRYVRLEMLN